MKRNNKKGFTIVELVIVIAVIAILSAVLIPTFGTVIADANESARDQEARKLYTDYISDFDYSTGTAPLEAGYIVVDGYYYEMAGGNFVDITENQENTKPDGTIVIIKCNTCASDCTHD